MIDWAACKQPAQVQQVIVSKLGANKTVEHFYVFAKKEGLECSKPTKGVIYCSITVPSKLPLTKKKWLIQIQVLNNKIVSDISVSEGYIGP